MTGREPDDQAAGNGSRGRAGGIRLFRCVPMFPVLSRCGQCRWLQSSLRVSPAVARVHGAVRVRTGGQAGSIKRAPASPDEGGGADTYALLGDMPAGHLDIGLAVPRGQPGPAAQLGGAAEPVHVADLGDDDRGQRRPVRQPRQAARSATPPPRSSGPAASADPARGRTPGPPASQPTPTTIRRSSRPGDKRRAPRTRPGLALGIRSASLWPAFPSTHQASRPSQRFRRRAHSAWSADFSASSRRKTACRTPVDFMDRAGQAKDTGFGAPQVRADR